MTKPYTWNTEKDDWLRRERGIKFTDIVNAIKKGKILADIENPRTKYNNQKMYIVELSGYAIIVPYVEDENKIFLKTAFPSRKAKQKFLT